MNITTKTVLLIISIFTFGSNIKAMEKPIQFEGIVFAYDVFSRLTKLQNNSTKDILYVKVTKTNSNNKIPRYISIRNFPDNNKYKIPEKVFKGKSKWTFTVKKGCFCDSVVENWNDEFEVHVFETYKDLKPNMKLSCFALLKNGLNKTSVRVK